MTTHLQGTRTQFLPFNRGSDPGGPDCGAGNPVMAGHRTAYLWEEVWERHSWLEILGRYCIAERDKKKQIRRLVFPRYHQLAVTRLLLQAVLEESPGWRYLIQHSAGSGKTASIGWSSHLLADLHDENDRKLFDTVLVVSDRSVIDSQLQETLENFERHKDVVASITTEKGIKSDQLAEALSGDKKIVVCTIQTFPALISRPSSCWSRSWWPPSRPAPCSSNPSPHGPRCAGVVDGQARLAQRRQARRIPVRA
jgi:type I restriction enzyme R subunit